MTDSPNVELVRSIYTDWERGDFKRVEWADPEIEFERRGGLVPLSVRGVAAMGEAWREFMSAWAGVSTTADEYRELDGERILVCSHYSGRGRTSGWLGEMRLNVAALFQMRGGKVTRLTLWRDRARALADLGLEGSAVAEESTTPDLVERVHHTFEAVTRRDVDAIPSRWAPDGVWDLNAWGIGTFEGPSAIRGFVEDWLGNYEDYLADAEEILDLGNGVSFVAYREVARPMGSQGRTERRQAYVALERGGLIKRMTMYADIDEARAAAERLAQERG
jgi:ketosteroid isomerase-like protein